MPPGTGDVPLTVFQSLPIDGIVIVTTPQDLVGMIVAKAVRMAEMMNVPVLGLVENMSYFTCPDCGKKHEIFGASQADSVAKEFDIAHVARLPIDPKITAMVDAGQVEQVSGDYVSALVDSLEQALPLEEKA
jgi:Mrp family chromosome partitioning ATPase